MPPRTWTEAIRGLYPRNWRFKISVLNSIFFPWKPIFSKRAMQGSDSSCKRKMSAFIGCWDSRWWLWTSVLHISPFISEVSSWLFNIKNPECFCSSTCYLNLKSHKKPYTKHIRDLLAWNIKLPYLKAQRSLWLILAQYLKYVLKYILIRAISLFHCTNPHSWEFSYKELNRQ